VLAVRKRRLQYSNIDNAAHLAIRAQPADASQVWLMTTEARIESFAAYTLRDFRTTPCSDVAGVRLPDVCKGFSNCWTS
jgi:hypothetical protein